MDAFMARVEAMEILDTPMEERVSLLPVEQEVKPSTTLKGKGKEKTAVSPILDGGSGCENGFLFNSGKIKAEVSSKDKIPPLNLKTGMANRKGLDHSTCTLQSNPTKETQTSDAGTSIKDVTKARESIYKKSSLLEADRKLIPR